MILEPGTHMAVSLAGEGIKRQRTLSASRSSPSSTYALHMHRFQIRIGINTYFTPWRKICITELLSVNDAWGLFADISIQ